MHPRLHAIFRRKFQSREIMMMKRRCGLAAAAFCACLAWSAIASAVDTASAPDPELSTE